MVKIIAILGISLAHAEYDKLPDCERNHKSQCDKPLVKALCRKTCSNASQSSGGFFPKPSVTKPQPRQRGGGGSPGSSDSTDASDSPDGGSNGGSIDSSLNFMKDPKTWRIRDLEKWASERVRNIEDTSALSEGNKNLLLTHNVVRCLFGVAPLAWSTRMEKGAKETTKHMVNQGVWGHVHKTFMDPSDTSTGMGENLATGTGGTQVPYNAAGWLNEFITYHYDGRTYTGGIGHFTAMIWAGTREMACSSVQRTFQGSEDLIACKYFPVGNSGSGDANLPDTCVNSLDKCEAEFNYKLNTEMLHPQFMPKCSGDAARARSTGNQSHYKTRSSMYTR